MNIFTANQVNHVYVVNTYPSEGSPTLSNSDVTFKVKDSKLYFTHNGEGGVTRSDIIPLDNILYTRGTKCENTRQKLMSALVTVNASALSEGKLIAGQDYIMNLDIQNPVGMSPDNRYMTFGAVHAISNMTPAQFYAKMVESINKNVKNALDDCLTIGLPDITVGGITFGVQDNTGNLKIQVADAGTEAVTYTAGTGILLITPASDSTTATLQAKIDAKVPKGVVVTVKSIGTLEEGAATAAATGILISGKKSSWILGVKQQKPVIFNVLLSTVKVGSYGTEAVWMDVTYSNGKKITGGEEVKETTTTDNVPAAVEIPNGELMADYEYFYMGERADQYRYVGWPNYVPTTYRVKTENEYDTVAIHYAYTGANHAVQKSEKDITFLVKRDGSNHLAYKFATAVNSALTSASEATIFATSDTTQFDQ